jgi:hypothetical protein
VHSNEVATKDHSENEGILTSLISAGLVELPHRFIPSGFVEIPICQPKGQLRQPIEEIKKMEAKGRKRQKQRHPQPPQSRFHPCLC